MGLSFTKLFGLFFPKQEIQIVMMGLGAASKTTILYKLKLGQVVSTDITVGFNVEMVEYKIINFSVMDVGGQSRACVSQECNDGQVKTRPLWSIYFRKTPCLIFVIDSNDRERVDDARNELHLTLQKGELSDAVLLVFANKQDLPNAMNTTELTDKLGLHSLGQPRWHIQGTSAISGEGLQEGLDWICTTVLGEGEQAHEQK